jgi:hypothetical protein
MSSYINSHEIDKEKLIISEVKAKSLILINNSVRGAGRSKIKDVGTAASLM